jgi:uncharacterized protein (DUF433 family)
MKWHELLGAVLMDFFEGTPYKVTTETDLSVRKQLLDVVIIRKTTGELDRELPDGLAPLANHNLISFKSHQDSFDSWAALELVGHYMNYRKQVSPARGPLLPAEEFRLFGIASRFPENLAKELPFEECAHGVYDVKCGPIRIRLLVIRNLDPRPANAMLQLFSVNPEQIQYACEYYHPHHEHTSSIVGNLIRKYRKEDPNMVSTLKEMHRKLMKGVLVEDRLDGLTPEQILEVFPPEKLLNAMSPEQIEKYVQKAKAAKPTKTRRKPQK